MTIKTEKTTRARRRQADKVAPQPGLTPAEPERPEDIVVEGLDDERDGDKALWRVWLFGRLGRG